MVQDSFSQQREEREVHGGVSAVRVLRQGFRILVIARMQTPMGQTVRKTKRTQGCSILAGWARSVSLVSSGGTRLVATVSCVHNGLLDHPFVSQRRCSRFTESPDLQRCKNIRPCHFPFSSFSRRGLRCRPHRFDRVCSHSRCILPAASHGMCPLLAQRHRLNPFSHWHWEGRRESSIVCALLSLRPSCNS